MTEAEERARNKAVVTQFFDRMNAGDLDGSFGLLTDDCTWFSLSSRRFSGLQIAPITLCPRRRRALG